MWAVEVEQRRGRNVAGVAPANKNARTAWALLAKDTDFQMDHLPPDRLRMTDSHARARMSGQALFRP